MDVTETLTACAEAIRKILGLARSNPTQIALPEQSLKIVINASLVGAFLVFANRSLMYPETVETVSKLGINLVMAASSIVFVFGISAILSLVTNDNQADQTSDRWSFLFYFVWIVALLGFLVDLIFNMPVGSFIQKVRGGHQFGLDLGIIWQLAVYVVGAYLILFTRTFIFERSAFSIIWSTIGFLIVAPICVAMLYTFIQFDVK
jgi:hypothetical protein